MPTGHFWVRLPVPAPFDFMNDIDTFDPVNDGSKGLVFVGDKIIVYRRDHNTAVHPGEIDLPGGGREGQETPFETFQREVQEEFALAIARQDVVYGKGYVSKLDPSKHGYFIVVKLPASMESQIVLGDEGLECQLMTVEEYLARQDAWTVFQERTRDYLNAMETDLY